MKMNKKMFFFLLITFILCGNATTQSNLMSSGQSIITNSGSVSISVGQLFTNSVAPGEYMLQEGVQQPFEIHDIVATSDHSKMSVKIWPNPVITDINLEINYVKIDELSYVLLSNLGQELKAGKLNTINNISIQEMLAGIYILSIIHKNHILSSYKLV